MSDRLGSDCYACFDFDVGERPCVVCNRMIGARLPEAFRPMRPDFPDADEIQWAQIKLAGDL